ncbi:MAG: NAD(P)/FAD-dependent oxidoreductase [Acidobacteria bacterium]|nr:NAD(P)/FAD-dependent oxidoreductase [Acidobacteriota bacterium]
MAERAEIVVVGAGPAGIAAACAARECGRSVRVVDENPHAGGQIWRGELPQPWRTRWEQAAVPMQAGATAFGFAGEQTLLVECEGRAMEIAFERLIVATGARERLLPFPGWTLPGVTGAGGLQALMKSGLDLAGRRVVVAGSGPLLAEAGASLLAAGALVAIVAEQASFRQMIPFLGRIAARRGKWTQALRIASALRKTRYRAGAWPLSVERRDGALSVTLRLGPRREVIECDYLACGFGLLGNTELAQLAGCQVVNGCVVVDEHQRTSVLGIYCAGEPVGIAGVESALAQGLTAGYHAAGREDLATACTPGRDRGRRFQRVLAEAFALRPELKELATPDTIICRCEDVRLGELAGFLTWREAKLHTRCGMGACQGRVCGAALEFVAGMPAASVRPPLVPVSVGVLAGEQ